MTQQTETPPKPAPEPAAAPQAEPAGPAGAPAPARLGPVAVLLKLLGAPATFGGAALALLVALSSVVLIVFAVRAEQWFIAWFEGVNIVAGALAFLTLIGRLRVAPALSLAIAGAVTGAGAVLSEPAMAARLLDAGGLPNQFFPFSLIPIMLARLGASALMMLLACVIVWAREPRLSARYLVWAVVTGVPALALLAPILVGRVRAAVPLPDVTSLGAVGKFALAAGAIAAFFAIVTLVSIAGHCLIRSLEVGRRDPPPARDGA